MNIVVNGKGAEVSGSVNILELLQELKVEAPEYVSVELNGEILSRNDFPTINVSEGDAVEFLYFMGGGSQWA